MAINYIGADYMENYNIEKEIWKDIEGYEGKYQVSNLGRVKSLRRKINRDNISSMVVKERILKPTYDYRGYPIIHLKEDGNSKTFRIHRLVANNFLPKINEKEDVNHIDENKENNSISNLEWVNKKENCNHGTRNDRISLAVSKPIAKIDIKTNEVIKKYSSITNAEIDLGKKQGHSTITKVLKGKTKQAYGFYWKYI